MPNTAITAIAIKPDKILNVLDQKLSKTSVIIHHPIDSDQRLKFIHKSYPKNQLNIEYTKIIDKYVFAND